MNIESQKTLLFNTEHFSLLKLLFLYGSTERRNKLSTVIIKSKGCSQIYQYKSTIPIENWKAKAEMWVELFRSYKSELTQKKGGGVSDATSKFIIIPFDFL